MDTPKITAWLKTYCGWSNGVRAVLNKYNLPFEERDIIKNPELRFEMEQRSGQPLSPCVEINGVMLPDISGEEVEAYLIESGLIAKNDAPVGVPTNAPCSDAEHDAMRRGAPLKFQP
jgi:monothiol glutaredoxin